LLLTYKPEKSNSAYAQLLVDVDDSWRVDALIAEIDEHLQERFPDVSGYSSRFQLGSGSTDKIRARLSGPDADVLRGPADGLFSRLRPQIEAVKLPRDYTLEWGGEYEDSGDARRGQRTPPLDRRFRSEPPASRVAVAAATTRWA